MVGVRQFTLFTYLCPFLEHTTGVNVHMLSLLLLAMGVFGLLGTFVIDIVLKTRLFSVLIMIPFTLWGFLGTSAPVGWWAWLAQPLPHEAEVGGLLFDAYRYESAFVFSASLLGMATLIAGVTAFFTCKTKADIYLHK